MIVLEAVSVVVVLVVEVDNVEEDGGGGDCWQPEELSDPLFQTSRELLAQVVFSFR